MNGLIQTLKNIWKIENYIAHSFTLIVLAVFDSDLIS